ncbi:MAG: 1-acyl-sn-glycerol-3-phosphate acyltransferase [Bacteroidota bacterium]|nr:1-acyl-sn-glycerol-3-phosphate acyltransferase [Bacteroidota bacterium]
MENYIFAMMKILIRMYSTYSLLVFAGIFILFLPLFLIFIQNKKWHYYAYKLNYYWAKGYYFFSFLPVEKVYKVKLNKNQQYIFCPNHTSFLDIPLTGLTPNFFVFVGKSSISKVPLFGYMYKKLHITVDRGNMKSKYDTLKSSIAAIEEGKSLVIFPEGGIYTENPPHMTRFKDGPFRVAIEKQIPIVPVTIPYNWKISPDDGKLMVFWHKSKIIYHEPIQTQGLTLKDVDLLKNKVYEVIKEELEAHIFTYSPYKT